MSAATAHPVARRIALAVLLALLCGCRKPAAVARPAYLVVTADTAGWIVPCGCTANQSGGLLRRGTYLSGLRASADVLYADAGGAPAGDSPYQLAKFQAVLAGEAELGIAAHNLGRGEVAFGPTTIRSTTTVPFISANTRSAADGKPLANGARVVTLAGRRIALVGVCSPKFATPAVRISDPRQAIDDAVAARRGQYDALVVLAYLPEDELAALAASLPEADAVVGGPTGQPIIPRAVGPTVLAAATAKGKFAVRLQMPASGPWSGQVDELGPNYGDDAPQAANLRAFLNELRARDFSAADTGLGPVKSAGAPDSYRIAGSASCTACHKDAVTLWHATHHASAWATLVAKGSEVDPSCQQCHTTGYGQPGGFDHSGAPGADSLLGVGCESCHGPSLAHVRDAHVRTPYIAFDQCIRCHDHENSPAFDRTLYWSRIRHGKGQSPTTAP